MDTSSAGLPDGQPSGGFSGHAAGHAAGPATGPGAAPGSGVSPWAVLAARLGVGSSSARSQVVEAVEAVLVEAGYPAVADGGPSVVSFRFGRLVLQAAPHLAAGLRLDAERVAGLVEARSGVAVQVSVEVARHV